MKDEAIKEIISTLNNINYQIAEFSRIKEELDRQLAALLEHGDEGSKTYIHGKYKVTVTSGYNYTLNKEEWEIIGSRMPICFQPVRQRMAYDIDKNIIRDCERYGSQEDKMLMSEFISKKSKKIHIKISAGI